MTLKGLEPKNMSTKKNVGFIGIGLMGAGMARSLIRQGHTVRIYNRTRGKAEAVARLGGTVTDTPADAARGAEVIITMVADPTALRGVD
jgi:3-hydroxyisobutyrate dehydrogenase